MYWMNKQYCRWRWTMRRYVLKASAIWKEPQATELWPWSRTQEPAGYSDLTDMSLHPPICCAVAKEEDCISLCSAMIVSQSCWWVMSALLSYAGPTQPLLVWMSATLKEAWRGPHKSKNNSLLLVFAATFCLPSFRPQDQLNKNSKSKDKGQ